MKFRAYLAAIAVATVPLVGMGAAGASAQSSHTTTPSVHRTIKPTPKPTPQPKVNRPHHTRRQVMPVRARRTGRGTSPWSKKTIKPKH